MRAKNLLTVALLLFVGAAVATIILREAGSSSSVSVSTNAAADAPLPANGIVAYYFHSEIRCPTCRNIEAYAHEAIQTYFPEELSSGAITWLVVNYELPASAHFVTDYEIVSPTVVLVRLAEGQQTEWRNLTRVWELVGEKDAFVEYVHQQAKELL